MNASSPPDFIRRAHLDLGSTPAVQYRRDEVIFSPGDACDSVMYIQRGGVKVSAVSKSGREAVVAVLGPGDFLGEGCLAGERSRKRSATALTASTILVVARQRMIRLLGRRPVCDRLLSHVLGRHASMEQDLIDQLASSVEKELARRLLLLAGYGTHGVPQRVLRRPSEKALAQMLGATRTQVSALMTRFQRAGFIEYGGKLVVNRSLLSVVLHD